MCKKYVKCGKIFGMKEITLKVTGRQCSLNENLENEENVMEFITEGQLFTKDEATYIVYEESEVSGMAGCKTTLKITSDAVRMKRIGNVGFGAELFFKEGRRFNSTYRTPYGPMGIEVLTKSVENSLNEDSIGVIDIEYDVSLEGMNESKNKLTINIM